MAYFTVGIGYFLASILAFRFGKSVGRSEALDELQSKLERIRRIL